MNRQRLILFVLAIVFGVSAFWSYTAVPRLKTVDKLTYPPGQQAKPVSTPSGASAKEKYDGRILNIALLEQLEVGFNGYRRNLFKPIFVDEQKMLKQKSAASKPPQLPQLPPVQPQKAASVVLPTAQPEAVALARFTFLGFMKKDASNTIFLARDKDIFLVKKGEKVSGRYEASSITEQALTLIDSQTGDEIVVPLIENKPLAAAVK